MKKSILAAAAIAALSAAGVMAQHGEYPFGRASAGNGSATAPATDPATLAARQVSFLTQLLTLTTGQQTQATAYFTAGITANQALQTQEATARTALLTAIKANDSAGITTQSNAIGNIVAQETANTAKADAAFYALLTADQKTKLDSLNDSGFFGPGFDLHVPGGH